MEQAGRPPTYDEVRALSRQQRRELLAQIHLANAVDSGDEARRLSITDLLAVDERVVSRRRRRALIITSVCTLLLIPWTFYLALTLPSVRLVRGWTFTWVGFDILLAVFLGLTAFFAWRRRVLLVLAATGTGALLIADAWFDITTASRRDRQWSVLTAVLIELPLAAFLIAMSVMLLRRVAKAVLALRDAEQQLDPAIDPEPR